MIFSRMTRLSLFGTKPSRFTLQHSGPGPVARVAYPTKSTIFQPESLSSKASAFDKVKALDERLPREIDGYHEDDEHIAYGELPCRRQLNIR